MGRPIRYEVEQILVNLVFVATYSTLAVNIYFFSHFPRHIRILFSENQIFERFSADITD